MAAKVPAPPWRVWDPRPGQPQRCAAPIPVFQGVGAEQDQHMEKPSGEKEKEQTSSQRYSHHAAKLCLCSAPWLLLQASSRPGLLPPWLHGGSAKILGSQGWCRDPNRPRLTLHSNYSREEKANSLIPLPPSLPLRNSVQRLPWENDKIKYRCHKFHVSK